jgi:hypothetical protein
MTIERSPGIPAVAGGVCYGLAGGGYQGLTAELDAVVQQAAERLQAAYGMDVVIRFNSDRASGGAWLRTHDHDAIGANSEIGIGAFLVTEETIRIRRKYDWDGQDEAPGTIHLTAHVAGTSLADQSLKQLPGWNGPTGISPEGYYHGRVASVEEALALVPAGRLDPGGHQAAARRGGAMTGWCLACLPRGRRGLRPLGHATSVASPAVGWSSAQRNQSLRQRGAPQ